MDLIIEFDNKFKPTYIGVSGIIFFNISQDNISNLIHELFWDEHQTTKLCLLKSCVAYPQVVCRLTSALAVLDVVHTNPRPLT